MSNLAESNQTPVSLWWAFPALALVLMMLLAMLVGSPPQTARARTTLDASDEGVRAAFLLLQSLDLPVRASRRGAEGRVRWMLFPERPGRDQALLEGWVRNGGRLLLGARDDAVAREFQLPVESRPEPESDIQIVLDGGPLRLAAGGGNWLATTRPPLRTWPEGSKQPLASIFPYGRGEIWVLHHASFLHNKRLRKGDHAELLVRLAQAFAGPERSAIYFDDAIHGLRQRPGVVELLLQPPVLWTTLASVGLLGLVLWRYLPRFGPIRQALPPRRRSKEEYLDALAHLLLRKRAYAEACQVARDALARDLEEALQVPPGIPPESLAEIACQRAGGLDRQRLVAALSRSDLNRLHSSAFLTYFEELTRIRREFFYG